MEKPSLSLEDVSVAHGRVTALSGLTLGIPCGTLTAVVGPNGAGKTTLPRAILGWLPLRSGTILIEGVERSRAGARLAYLPQRAEVDWDFPITVRGVVEQGRYRALAPFRGLSASDRARVDRAMEELGMTALADRQIRMLSGGQQQRMFLARALAQGADIFLLDEPFTGLDLFAVEELTHILRAWEAAGRTVVAAVHDLAAARQIFSRAILLDTARVADGPIDEVLTEANIDRAYRRGRCVHQGGPLPYLDAGRFPR